MATAEYLCWLLNMPHTLYMATGMIHGQTRTRINMGRLAELQVPIPPLPLQQKFSQIVKKFERLRAQQREAERQAEHLFQTLLHQTFEGVLTLDSADVYPESGEESLQYPPVGGNASSMPLKMVAEEATQLALPLD